MIDAPHGRRLTPSGSLVDRFAAALDRLISSPRFHRWATTFPLARPIARRQARELFDLCAGFVYSQVLTACVRVRLFEALSDGPQDLQQLSERLALSRDATERLLDAAVALRLASRRGRQRYGIGMLGAAILANPGIAAMVEHHEYLYDDLRDPVALLRGGQGSTALSGYWSYAATHAPASLERTNVDAYTTLMSASQPLVSGEVLNAYQFGKHACLLDVGGGDGSFLAAVGAVNHDLRLMLFDLPAVVDRGRLRFETLGLSARAQVCGGNFLTDPLPQGADIVSLVRVLHDHDDEQALMLLRAVHRALPANGTVLIAEPMSGVRGAEPVGDAYFGFYLLAMGQGRPRSLARISEMLEKAGFHQVRLLPTQVPLKSSLVVARSK